MHICLWDTGVFTAAMTVVGVAQLLAWAEDCVTPRSLV